MVSSYSSPNDDDEDENDRALHSMQPGPKVLLFAEKSQSPEEKGNPVPPIFHAMQYVIGNKRMRSDVVKASFAN
jgi:hypothetical protein